FLGLLAVYPTTIIPVQEALSLYFWKESSAADATLRADLSLTRRGVRVGGDDAGREPQSLIQAVGGLGAGSLQLPAVGQGEAAEELAGGGGGRGVGHRTQGCSRLIGPQPLDVAEVASPGEHALGHRHHELTRAEP